MAECRRFEVLDLELAIAERSSGLRGCGWLHCTIGPLTELGGGIMYQERNCRDYYGEIKTDRYKIKICSIVRYEPVDQLFGALHFHYELELFLRLIFGYFDFLLMAML